VFRLEILTLAILEIANEAIIEILLIILAYIRSPEGSTFGFLGRPLFPVGENIFLLPYDLSRALA